MPSQPAADDRRARLRELRDVRRENALRLEIAQQRQQLRALALAGATRGLHPGEADLYEPPPRRSAGYRESGSATEDLFDPDFLFVNASDYIGEVGYGYGYPQQSPWLSTRSDRQDGRNRPMFATETELAAIRGAARLLANYNPNAKGILKHLANFTISKGFAYRFSMLDGKSADQTPAKHCQRVVDRFLCDNAFVGDYDRELFHRAHRDGESFLGLWHEGHGRVAARAIEPEQVTEPAAPRDIEDWLDRAGNDKWSFGIHTDGDDTESVRGIYAQWSNNPQDWSYLPAGRHPCLPPNAECNAWVEHYKTDNVDRKIKRGLSDFFCGQVMLEAARKLQRNMGAGASIQAAIAWIIETAAGTLPTTVTSMTASQSAGPYTQQTLQGNRVNQTAKYDPGSILYAPNGTVYHPSPMGSDNAPNFVLVYESMMRSLAVMWCMPEHMVTGSAENNNYASILEAGSPFVRAIESEQARVALSHERILWKVIEFACACGEIPCDYETVRCLVRLSVSPPRVPVRDRLREVQADQVLVGLGAMSAATAAANDGLDYQQEKDQGAVVHLAKGKETETPVDAAATAAAANGQNASDDDPLANTVATTESALPQTGANMHVYGAK
jgi:hypothetical protein